MTWDEATYDYVRERLLALADAVQRSVQTYVNHPSRLQAEAGYELMEELWDAWEGAEGNRVEVEKETKN